MEYNKCCVQYQYFRNLNGTGKKQNSSSRGKAFRKSTIWELYEQLPLVRRSAYLRSLTPFHFYFVFGIKSKHFLFLPLTNLVSRNGWLLFLLGFAALQGVPSLVRSVHGALPLLHPRLLAELEEVWSVDQCSTDTSLAQNMNTGVISYLGTICTTNQSHVCL